MSTRQSRWPWILVAVVVLAAGAWLFRSQEGRPVVEGSGQPAAPAPLEEIAVAGGEPAVRHPLDPRDMADEAIPALDDSDATAWDTLAGLVGDASVLDVLLRDHLVQRLVTMIDNLDQPRIPTRALALRALPGDFLTEPEGDALYLSPANPQRYEPWVRAFTGTDAARLAVAYRRFYPLFQQAYAEIAGPNAYFNDRLVSVIDHLLQVPEPEAMPRLEPAANGRFRYADPRLESRSVGQKALLRLSAEQRGAVKHQLRALRTELAHG